VVNLKKWFLLLLSVVILSCSSVYNVQKKNINRDESIVILPFENFTEVPLAGQKASGIAEGVFVSKGFNISERFYNNKYEDYSDQEIKDLLKKASSKNIKYAVTGYVNEWRYKTGEPAVSITLKIIETETGKTVWTAVGSKTGWGYESVGTVAQKLINEMIDGLRKNK